MVVGGRRHGGGGKRKLRGGCTKIVRERERKETGKKENNLREGQMLYTDALPRGSTLVFIMLVYMLMLFYRMTLSGK